MAFTSFTSNTSNLQRYRPALYGLIAIAAAFAIYHVYDSAPTPQEPKQLVQGLHRSNAQRRRRSQLATSRNHDSRENAQPSVDFLSSEADDSYVHGSLRCQLPTGEVRQFELSRTAVSTWQYTAAAAGFRESERAQVDGKLKATFLFLYIYHHLEHRQVSDIQRDQIISSLVQSGFRTDRIQQVLALNRQCRLRAAVDAWISNQAVDGRDLDEIISDPLLQSAWREDHPSWEDALTIPNTANDSSSEDDTDHEEQDQGGRNLLNLLFTFADEQHRRSGFTHRGITCDSCGAHPIRGIRYRCSNCRDYDLCETCEAQSIHIPTHIFYKVRIPKAHLGHEKQPLKYTGKSLSHAAPLQKKVVDQFVKQTGFGEGEINGMWEQFRCQASADWPKDPFGYRKAINRADFQQLLIPVDTNHTPAPNLIYDRIFNFYDSDKNDLIGFKEMLDGLAILYKKGPAEKLKSVVKGFDLDGDGFIDRRDLLRMFKAHYAITKAMTDEIIVTSEEEFDDFSPEELINGGQPLSSNFSLQVPASRPARSGEGKDTNHFGDFIINDGRGIINDTELDSSAPEIAVQRAEQKVFGSLVLKPDRQTNVDITEIVGEIYDDAWPSHWIEKSLGVRTGKTRLEDVNDMDDQRHFRRTAHDWWAWEWLNRQFVRRQALRAWRKRQAFLQAKDGAALSTDPVTFDEPYPTLNTILQAVEASQSLTIYPPGHEIFAFLQALDELIEPLRLHLSLENLRDSLVVLLDMGFSHYEIVECIKGYAMPLTHVEDIVAEMLQLAGKLSPQLQTGHRTRILPALEYGSPPSSKSLRSLILNLQSYESAPHPNEAKPELLEDHGQEIVYQITSEALNELIDPILKAREDLWLDAQVNHAERKLFRTQISNAVDDPSVLLYQTHAFLELCRIKENYPPPNEKPKLKSSVATTFFDFLQHMSAGNVNELTSELCPNCKDTRIEIGKWLWKVLSGDERRAFLEFEKRKTKSLLKLSALNGNVLLALETEITPSTANASDLNKQQASSPTLSMGNDTAPPSVDPSTPRQDLLDVASPVVARDTPTEEQYPKAAIELHELVSDFEAGNPEEFETAAAQKTVNELIDEAGYSVAASDDPSTSQENIVSKSSVSHQETSLPELDEHRDPTLPQHRPDKVPETSSTDDAANPAKPENVLKQPDVDLLRYWAALTILEAEDEQKRGGPGRISTEEFLDMMQGERGSSLAFLGDWMKLTSF